ncbi:hypothetical protein N5A93_18785 [Roseovarius sp. EGI FJ00037]|uniref:hypothetical protein n=1 Tax=Roseovarius TaxID=74030 RepID=UPI0022A8C8F8|nr:hypothetical protein [Roseovarius sp. EGI FJ00037]MCZ0814268.1 hypothetical protein [Roseovarius sp. EGI FJ00037]
MGAAASTVAGTAAASSITGLVGLFGTASTGTALAGLAGAAKSTATLYWIGSIVGGGVAAGTLITGVGAVGAGIYGANKVKRFLFGRPRRDTLEEREQMIVLAVTALIKAIDEALGSDRGVTQKEVALFSRIGVTPVREELEQALGENTFSQLKVYNRVRLRGHLVNLGSLQERLAT